MGKSRSSRKGKPEVRPREANGPRDPSRRDMLKKLTALGLLALVDTTSLVSCGRRAASRLARERKVIVLGLDGISPVAVERMLAEGSLPNMSRLRQMGGFHLLGSSVPPQSPVAWATFITGRDPGGHGLYDFIQRDPETYLPYLSIARTEKAERTLALGQWRLPLSQGKVELLRRGAAFWEVLEERGVPCAVYRVPSNFPPREGSAKQLAGLGAPDLRGTYGEYSYFTESPWEGTQDVAGGAIHRVTVSNGRVQARVIGPQNTLREGEPEAFVDFEVWLDRGNRLGKLVVQGKEILLRQGEWSEWVPLRFEMIPHVSSVSGICRFYLKEVSPHFKLYVTPVNVDPMDPALPITSPRGFARELAAKHGRFYTQGFPQDVKALRHGVLDDGEYLQQSGQALAEARRMYESALHDFRRGLLFYYFSTSDRTQHMFWRTVDPKHPAYDPQLARKYGSVIEDCYRTADELVGQALQAADRDTTVVVLSDHGFAPYYRAFSPNTWLAENGYLTGVQPWEGNLDIFSNADWGSTMAYGLGFNAVYLNLRGRERYGSVSPDERETAARYLAQELQRVRDPETGERIIENVYFADDVYSGATRAHAPDLVIGYRRGYRCGDSSVLGEVPAKLVEENRDKWSGDHCIDCSLVPGILLASKQVRAEAPALPDVTASVLAEFGVEKPDDMSGDPVW